MYCSIQQAVGIWDDLRDAMEDKNSYGGTVAEIYAFRLFPNIVQRNMDSETYFNAAHSLYDIIKLFQERYENAKFLVEGLDPLVWLKKHGKRFNHRVHVQFITTKGEQP